MRRSFRKVPISRLKGRSFPREALTLIFVQAVSRKHRDRQTVGTEEEVKHVQV